MLTACSYRILEAAHHFSSFCEVSVGRGCCGSIKICKKNAIAESTNLKLKLRTKKRKWVHGFNDERNSLGEFYHLYRDARFHPDKLYEYLRMTTNTFYTLLEKLEVHLCGPETNYREVISAEQQLVLTVRYDKFGLIIYFVKGPHPKMHFDHEQENQN
jgi:hypothetical protein